MKRPGQIPRWRQPTAERLDQLLALPMLVLTLVFLVVMILPVIYPGLPHEARAALAAIDLGIWAAFLAEYLARLFVAPDRFRFIIRNPFDLLLVAIPVLRPLGCCARSLSSAPRDSPGSARQPDVRCGRAGSAWPAVLRCWPPGRPRS